MPVATLIFIGPGIEVKAVKGDALGADRNGRHEGADFAVETVFVHAEVGRGVAEADETRHQRDGGAVMESPCGGGDRREALIAHQRPF